MSQSTVASIARRPRWLVTLLRASQDVAHSAQHTLAPLADLAIRLWLAQTFLVSAVLKFSNWEQALYLAAHEYPVTWLDPVSAAILGVTVETAAGVLLALGLATRFAALAALVLALVIQFNYRALDTHLFWAAYCFWLVLRGAGPLSLDFALARGLGETPLPFARALAHALRALTQSSAPWLHLALRGWLAAALWFAARGDLALAQWLPVSSTPQLGAGLLNLCALALLAGFATRALALVMLFATLALAMMQPHGYAAWACAFALIALYGPGAYSGDEWIKRRLSRRFPELEGKPAFALDGLPSVVIVGAGFAGITCAHALRHTPVSITLIDRRNYHLFQPLLYQVATASLSPGDIATPVRGMFREQFNARVLLGSVTGVDTARREVLMDDKRLPYDYLVLATGAAHSYFGRDEWEPYAPGLKKVEDAIDVRRRVLTAFERAEASDDPDERSALLTFLIVGGGPTGVELAGAIAELARLGMEKDFRRFDPAQARVLLVQAAPRVLPTFPEPLSLKAKESLEQLGVEVLLDSRVEKIDAQGVQVKGQRIEARTVIWAAGVVASPAAKWLGAAADSAGRVKVGADLSVAGLNGVYAVGDTALSTAWAGNAVPGLAPAAKQGGAYVAAAIRAQVEGRSPPAPFVYRHLGSLATIGRKSAIADFGFMRLSGALAWWLWGFIHVAFLVGLRNRISVMWDWFWAYLTLRGGTRLITGNDSRADASATALPATSLINQKVA